MQYEYLVVEANAFSEGTFSTSVHPATAMDELNAYGQDEWELVSITPIARGNGATNQVIYTFKRPLQSD